MKKYAIDFDGVLGNLSYAATQWAWERHGKQLTEADINAWGFNECFGVHYDDNNDFWEYVWRKHTRLYDGAVAFLMEIPGEVHVITQRPHGAPRDNFHYHFLARVSAVTKNIHLFNTWQEKERWILLNHPDAVLEDNLKFLLKLPETETRLYLMDRPWNQSADISKHYRRVKDYGEFLDAIKA